MACVVAVDDQPHFRALLCDLVDATDVFTVVGEADCGESAVDVVADLKPDLVLMDVRMPGIGGIAATERIKALLPSTIVVLVSTAHPEVLPATANSSADELVWKSELRPSVLAEIWQRHRDGKRMSSPRDDVTRRSRKEATDEVNAVRGRVATPR